MRATIHDLTYHDDVRKLNISEEFQDLAQIAIVNATTHTSCKQGGVKLMLTPGFCYEESAQSSARYKLCSGLVWAT